MNSTTEQIEKNGFTVIKNCINNKILSEIKACINNKLIEKLKDLKKKKQERSNVKLF